MKYTKYFKIFDYDKELIGQWFTNNAGHEYYVKCYGFQKNDLVYYQVVFPNTGYTTFVHKKGIKTFSVKDPFEPTIFGVAYMGNSKVGEHYRLYKTYRDIIARNYNELHSHYHKYGARGTRVSFDWLSFEHFIDDVTNFKGYHHQLIENGLIALDKDFLQKNEKKRGDDIMYSNYTCMFLDHTFNSCLPKSLPARVRCYSPVAKNIYEESSINRLAKMVPVPKEILMRVWETKQPETWNGWEIVECYESSEWYQYKMLFENRNSKDDEE